MKDFINNMTKNTLSRYRLSMSSRIPMRSSVALSFGNCSHRFWSRWKTSVLRRCFLASFDLGTSVIVWSLGTS